MCVFLHLFGTARLDTKLLPFCCAGTSLGTLSSNLGRVYRVSRVCVPCVMRGVFFPLKDTTRSPVGPKYASLCANLDS